MDHPKTSAAPSDDPTGSEAALIPGSQQPFAMALLACCLALMAWFVINQRIRQGRTIDIDEAGKIAWEMKVDVNHAKAPELAALPGVGPVLANAIVTEREEHGQFRSLDDMLRVPGIGPSKQQQLSGLLLFVVDSQDSDQNNPDD